MWAWTADIGITLAGAIVLPLVAHDLGGWPGAAVVGGVLVVAYSVTFRRYMVRSRVRVDGDVLRVVNPFRTYVIDLRDHPTVAWSTGPGGEGFTMVRSYRRPARLSLWPEGWVKVVALPWEMGRAVIPQLTDGRASALSGVRVLRRFDPRRLARR